MTDTPGRAKLLALAEKIARQDLPSDFLYNEGVADLIVYALRLAAKPAEEGQIPECETWWLIERSGTGLYACSNSQYTEWSPDPWRAQRFETARQADNTRLRLASDSLRDGSIVTEHVFINKMPTISTTGAPKS